MFRRLGLGSRLKVLPVLQVWHVLEPKVGVQSLDIKVTVTGPPPPATALPALTPQAVEVMPRARHKAIPSKLCGICLQVEAQPPSVRYLGIVP